MSYSRYSKRLHIQPVRKIPEAITDIYYQTRQFDTIDKLAQIYYGDPNLEWVIMCGNPDFSHSFQIPTGTIIRIPFPLSRVFNVWGIEDEL